MRPWLQQRFSYDGDPSGPRHMVSSEPNTGTSGHIRPFPPATPRTSHPSRTCQIPSSQHPSCRGARAALPPPTHSHPSPIRLRPRDDVVPRLVASCGALVRFQPPLNQPGNIPPHAPTRYNCGYTLSFWLQLHHMQMPLTALGSHGMAIMNVGAVVDPFPAPAVTGWSLTWHGNVQNVRHVCHNSEVHVFNGGR